MIALTHESKKKIFGEEVYVEIVGEWDYITNPLMYFVCCQDYGANI